MPLRGTRNEQKYPTSSAIFVFAATPFSATTVEVPDRCVYIVRVNCRWFFLAASFLIMSFVMAGCSNGPFSSQAADVPQSVTVLPNDTYFVDNADYQWYLRTIQAPVAWGLYESNAKVSYAGRDMQQVIVSVIDGGIVAGHEDLVPVLSTDGVSLVGGVLQPRPVGLPSSEVKNAHGTHVSGLIAAQGGNGRGIAGATYNGWPGPMFLVRPVIALDENGDGFVSDIAGAILYSAGLDNGLGLTTTNFSGVINMSLGADSLHETEALLIQNAVQAASEADVLMVAAAGNGTDNGNIGRAGGVDLPAAFSEIIAVGSIDSNLQRSAFSDFGPELELVAPGGSRPGNRNRGIVSTYYPERYAYSEGTSMATPLVAAAAAMVRSANPYLSAEKVRQILQVTARDLGPDGWDEEYGHGLVDMSAALRSALGEPYGRYSSSTGSSSRSVATSPTEVLSAERQAEYDRARAEAVWDPDGSDRITLLLAAGTDEAALIKETRGRLLFRANLPDGIMVRLELDGTTAARTFDQLRDRLGILLVSQDRPRAFLHSPVQ